MPIPTDWHSLKSDGTIPSDLLPCSQFQLGFFIRWEFPFDPAGITTIPTSASWRWTITDGGETAYDQQVQIGGFATVLFSLGTWFPTTPHLTTYVPTNPTIIGDPTGLISDEDINGLGTYFSLTFWYEGPMYEIALPPGAKLRVSHANVGGDWPFTLADVKIRTIADGDFGALWRPHDGTWRLVTQKGGGLQYSAAGDLRAAGVRVSDAVANPFSTAAAPSSPLLTTVLGTGTKPLPLRLPNRLCLLRQKGQAIEFLQTWDDGDTWEEPVQIATGVQYSGACLAGFGGTLLILGVRGGKTVALRCMFERDSDGRNVPRVVEEFTPTLADGSDMPVLPTSLQWLQHTNGRTHLLVNRSGGIDYFVSEDEMRTWDG